MGLLNTFVSTSLDLENPKPGGLLNRADLTTRYIPSTATGTPVSNGNPGPFKLYYQPYIPSSTYIDSNPASNSALQNTLGATGLDDFTPSKDPTKYPATNTGTPTSKANPGAPSNFSQVYTPTNTYLSTVGNGKLVSSIDSTNFDVENSLPNGGIPYKQDKDPTVYPAYNTGTPTSKANPGAPAKFNQTLTPTGDYLSTVGDGKLISSVDSTNFDIEDTSPNGGIPYKQDKDPTVYSKYSTGTPTSKTNPGAPRKFNQTLTPTGDYVSTIGKGRLISSVNSTNLDIESETPNGGIPYKQDKDPTSYSKYSTGTPTTSANPGIPKKFNQVYTPSKEYLSTNPVRGKGKLSDTVANTNLDVENEKPNGGIPYKVGNDPTVYPARTQAKSPTPGFFATPGKVASKFNPQFNPKNTYLDFIGA